MEKLADDSTLRQKMSEQSRSIGAPQAGELIASFCLMLAKSHTAPPGWVRHKLLLWQMRKNSEALSREEISYVAGKWYHFIGIGGVGMSGLAQVLLDMGMRVSGSDMALITCNEDLKQRVAQIYIGHSAG